jgi:hypothetical protein
LSNIKIELESWAYSQFWLDRDISSKLATDVFGYVKPEAYTVFIKLFLVFQETKELEKLLLVFLGDADTRVYHLNDQYWSVLFKFLNLDSNFNLTLLSKFDGVWLQAQEYLLDSLLVWLNHGIVLVDVYKFCIEL